MIPRIADISMKALDDTPSPPEATMPTASALTKSARSKTV
jgi:hypothetical protein